MLEAVGVASHDESIYRALLAVPRATSHDLSQRLSRDVSEVTRSLAALEQVGLVSQDDRQPGRYVPARPDVAVDALIARRKEELGRAKMASRELLAEMATEERHRSEDIVEVVVGRQGIANRFDHLLHSTRSELMVLDRPPYVVEPQHSEQRVQALLHSDICVRGIYATESLQTPEALTRVQNAGRAGEEARVHPQVPMKLAVADRRLALLPLTVDTGTELALAVHQSALLDALSQLFDLLWHQATPVAAASFDEPVHAEFDDHLVPLLAIGATDDAIARRLDVSTRTLSRRIAHVMKTLNARTRFQAGAQAVRFGWLDHHN